MTPADKAEIIEKCGQVDRTGLYIMVFLCLLWSCDSPKPVRTDPVPSVPVQTENRLERIEHRLERIEQKISVDSELRPAESIRN